MGVKLQGGKDDVRAGALMKIVGVLEVKGRWSFQAKHVAAVDNSLARLITRREPSRIDTELNHQRLDVNWREQVMGGEEEEKCSVILRCDTRSNVLWRQQEELTGELGGCG